jgi:hypothetical protein
LFLVAEALDVLIHVLDDRYVLFSAIPARGPREPVVGDLLNDRIGCES